MADSTRKSKMKATEPSAGTTIIEPQVEIHPGIMSGLQLDTQDLTKLMERPETMASKTDPDADRPLLILFRRPSGGFSSKID